jgi:hypothetical protein
MESERKYVLDCEIVAWTVKIDNVKDREISNMRDSEKIEATQSSKIF